jgi:hypothetical protein
LRISVTAARIAGITITFEPKKNINLPYLTDLILYDYFQFSKAKIPKEKLAIEFRIISKILVTSIWTVEILAAKLIFCTEFVSSEFQVLKIKSNYRKLN